MDLRPDSIAVSSTAGDIASSTRSARARLRRASWAGVVLLVLAGCGGAGDDVQPPGDDGAAEEPLAGADAGEDDTDDTGDLDDTEGMDDTEGTDDTEGMDDTEGTDDTEGGDDGAATVMVGSTSLGEVLVDAEGMTLYLFDPDEQGESTCYEQCAITWPPLEAEGEPVAGEGADDSLLATVERDDGTPQVTYDGWPLYYYAPDSAPGDVTGQAVNGLWWVVSPDGEPVRS